MFNDWKILSYSDTFESHECPTRRTKSFIKFVLMIFVPGLNNRIFVSCYVSMVLYHTCALPVIMLSLRFVRLRYYLLQFSRSLKWFSFEWFQCLIKIKIESIIIRWMFYIYYHKTWLLRMKNALFFISNVQLIKDKGC